MEIKNGLVQWNGRNDIPCTYVEMEDGTKVYFKQDLENGNHIVTTSLLEAVDSMAKAQNIGLMDSEGNLIIPCVNRSIKVVEEYSMGNILLVEPAEVVSENVIEANNLRMDPLSATRLVSTPAQIKEKISAKMSPEGRYLFNDQFSEVTVTDLDGNNLVNGEYYSFVARDNDKLYMAKNYPETDVTEFSISEKKIIEEVKEELPVVEPTTEVTTEAVNNEIEIPVGNINEGFAKEDIDLSQGLGAAPAEEIVTDLGEEITIPTPAINAEVSYPEEDEVFSSYTETPEAITPEEVAEEVDQNIVVDDTNDRETDIEKRLSALNEKYDGMNSYMSRFETKSEDTTSNIEDDANEEDVFTNSEVKVDSIDDIEDEDIDETYDISEDIKDTTMEDATKALSDLAQKYTDKENELADALEREEKLKISRKNYIEKSKAQEQKINLINSKNHDLIDANTKLEAKVESLNMSLDLQKRKGEEQKRAINELTRENERLRSQLEGKEELARALESVKALIGDNDSYSEEESYYKVA